MHHRRNAKMVGRCKSKIAILRQWVHGMADGVQLQPDKLQLLHATFDLTLILLLADMRAHAGKTEESPWMLRAQPRNLVMRLEVICSAWVGLNDRCVDAALVHPPDHVFFRCKQPKNAALAKMGVRIDLLRHVQPQSISGLPVATESRRVK